jgi:hypothetical protein
MQSFFSVSSLRTADVHINKDQRKAIIRFPSEENACLAILMKHNTILGVDTILLEKLD